MADMRRLVWIDRGVFDNRLAAAGARRRRRRTVQALDQETPPFEEDVQVAVGRGRDARDAFERAKRAGNLLSDGSGRLAEPPRELERDGRAEIAEVALRRILERDGWRRGRVEAIKLLEQPCQMRAQPFVCGQDHRDVMVAGRLRM